MEAAVAVSYYTIVSDMTEHGIPVWGRRPTVVQVVSQLWLPYPFPSTRLFLFSYFCHSAHALEFLDCCPGEADYYYRGTGSAGESRPRLPEAFKWKGLQEAMGFHREPSQDLW